MHRREFIASSFSAVIAMRAGARFDRALTIGLVRTAGPRQASFFQGVGLGLEEMARAASLFAKQRLPAVRGESAESLLDQGATVMVACADDAATMDVARKCASAEVAFINCGARADSLRAICNDFVFHVEASNAMYSDAARVGGSDQVVLWHGSLERYGAAQLNDRFKQAAGQPMTGEAWSGWFAIKLIWESSLRLKDQTARSLAQHLSASRTQFDGHKGAPLSFRSWDHQLRQPLYALRAGDTIQDIPDAARSTGSPIRILDSIGARTAEKACS